MKKVFITSIIVMLMFAGMLSTASAITIGPSTPKQWTWQAYEPGDNPYIDDGISNNEYDNPTADVVALVTGNTVVELYRNDNPDETGDLAGSYDTSFGAGDEDATITYVSGYIVSPLAPAYLLVKDGNHDPIWYLYDLHDLDLDNNSATPGSVWNGKEKIDIIGLWLGGGSISHVALFGTKGGTTVPPPVPEPATMLLLGLGLIGIAGVGRKFRK